MHSPHQLVHTECEAVQRILMQFFSKLILDTHMSGYVVYIRRSEFSFGNILPLSAWGA